MNEQKRYLIGGITESNPAKSCPHCGNDNNCDNIAGLPIYNSLNLESIKNAL